MLQYNFADQDISFETADEMSWDVSRFWKLIQCLIEYFASCVYFFLFYYPNEAIE